MLRRLIEMLDEGGYSCVVANGDDVRCFMERGVADLYRLWREEAHFLHGASVADKVVGKGAAALMAGCGVRELYTHTISCGAKELLEGAGVCVECGEVVPHIINRAGDGWCPIELRCRDSESVEEILRIVDEFIKEQKSKK